MLARLSDSVHLRNHEDMSILKEILPAMKKGQKVYIHTTDVVNILSQLKTNVNIKQQNDEYIITITI